MISRRAALVGLTAAAAFPARAADDPVKAAADDAVADFLKSCRQSVGLSLGIWRAGRALHVNAGHVAPGSGKAPTSRTLYPIASITKTFTGLLLAQAQIEGRLKLDDDVRKYLDGDYPNLEFEGHYIRLFDLVDHRSGLPFLLPDRPETRPHPEASGAFTARLAEIEKTYSRQDFYADLRAVALKAAPGTQFAYSNAGAMLAGYILERVYGLSYEALVLARIALPLGMRDTVITLSPDQEQRLVKGYDTDGAAMPDNPDAIQAAGALKSTAADLLTYAAWQAAESDPAVRLSHQSYTGEGSYQAGLNWQMINAEGRRLIWQSGNIEGFHSYCVVQPELKLAVVALFNEADEQSNTAHNVLVNAVLKGADPRALLLP
jgi:CubicO group peptidase (beta-lactamase class C family)